MTAQAIDAASASLTVWRKNKPTAMDSWMTAKAVLYSAMCCAMTCADQMTGRAISAGFPAATGAMVVAAGNPAEHIWLELQGRVEQPHRAKEQLQRSPRWPR